MTLTTVKETIVQESLEQKRDRIVRALCASIERAARVCPESFKLRFIKLCYLVLSGKLEASPTARQWAEQMEAEHGHFTQSARDAAKTVHQVIEVSIVELDETEQHRLRPEILGAVSKWAETTGEY